MTNTLETGRSSTGSSTEQAAGIEVRTLGCKVNFADMRSLAATLGGSSPAGSILVGTCCVTAEGEKQSRKEVRRALRQAGPDGTVFVAGCAAKLHPEVYRAMGANVRLTLEDPGEDVGASLDSMSEAKASASPCGRTRFFLKVQDGCANMCSYCVIPGVRGRPVSLPAAEILTKASAAVKAGYPELVITGINTGSYRDEGIGLAGLLDRLATIPFLKRLRLSSIEAVHVNDDLLDVIGRHRLIGRQLHLPLQSGDAGVLKAMGRRYDPEEFLKITARIRSRIPEINLTTDVIAGFPGEDEQAFANTLAAVGMAGFSRVHAFTYSPRPGTRAAVLGDPVPPQEKKRRSARLRALSERLQEAHRRRKLGRLDEILLESPEGGGRHGGYSSDYTRYVVEGGRSGDIVCVMAELVKPEGIWGKISEERTT